MNQRCGQGHCSTTIFYHLVANLGCIPNWSQLVPVFVMSDCAAKARSRTDDHSALPIEPVLAYHEIRGVNGARSPRDV